MPFKVSHVVQKHTIFLFFFIQDIQYLIPMLEIRLMYFQKFSCILSVKISGRIKPSNDIQICEIFLNLRIYTVPGLRTENRTVPSGKLRYLYDSRNLHDLLSIVMILVA